MYTVTQNRFQSHRIDFREQIVKSSKVMILYGDIIMQSTSITISCLWHRRQNRYTFSVFLVPVVWTCVWFL